jgi:response regulator RpfG family c-di-GMP phosphodiesterase
MNHKILLVDDDPNILQGYQRQLHKDVDIETAQSGSEGLKLLQEKGPFAVIISDLRMPGMDGIAFLSDTRKQSPDSVRVMLTGHADLEAAINAVNKGNIFRLLTKPCPAENLLQTVQDSIRQYELIISERVLLERTLSGSVKVLTEILSLVNPTAFSRATRIKPYVHHIATYLKLPNVWEFELAALFSQIGCITLPTEIIDKIYAKETLNQEERKMYAEHPETGGNLIAHIPRLERISAMVKAQQKPFHRRTKGSDYSGEDRIALGGFILKVVLDFDQLLSQDTSVKAALRRLSQQLGHEVPEIVAALDSLRIEYDRNIVKSVRVSELDRSMIIDEDVFATDGMLRELVWFNPFVS